MPNVGGIEPLTAKKTGRRQKARVLSGEVGDPQGEFLTDFISGKQGRATLRKWTLFRSSLVVSLNI